MSARDGIDLICSSADFMLPKIAAAESEVFDELGMSGSTVYVNALRAFRIHRAVVAVGMFSMYEAALQFEFGWDRPFEQLREELLAKKHSQLATRFRNYALAVNVLKHGEGRSLDELLAQKDSLEFRVKAQGEFFLEEGDVSEGQHLVDADNEFVQGCARVIDHTLRIAREQVL